MKDKRIVEWGLSNGLTGCTRDEDFLLSDVLDMIDVSESEFDNMSEDDQEEALQKFAIEHMWEYLECWATIK